MDTNEMIRCPLYGHDIDYLVCFDVSMVAEHLAPERTIDPKIRGIKNYREICLACKNHRD